jgi:hypothetical protein
MAIKSSNDRNESLRVEYQAAIRYAIHCTELNWQVGSILIGGSLASVALSLTAPKPRIPAVLVTLAATVAILAWYLFLRRNRDFAHIATVRMVSIERELGLEWGLQSLVSYASGGNLTYPQRVTGPSGFVTASFLAFGLVIILLILVIYLVLCPYLACPLV